MLNFLALIPTFALSSVDQPADVVQSIVELKRQADWWKVNTISDVPTWIAESHELAKSFVYCPETLAAA